MAGLPTLGGIKSLQKFLKVNAIDLPLFQMEIYSKQILSKSDINSNQEPTKIITVPISRFIRIYGENQEVTDRRISSKDGLEFIRFRDPIKCGFANKIDVVLNKTECWIEYSPKVIDFVLKNKKIIREILKTKS